MKKVTGIGGIFLKCKDPKAVNDWYKTHLGFDTTPYGTSFEWLEKIQGMKALPSGILFPEDTDYFQPSEKDFMINYRVDNLEALILELKTQGIEMLDEVATYSYGKFAHIIDPEGNKIQLWEPT